MAKHTDNRSLDNRSLDDRAADRAFDMAWRTGGEIGRDGLNAKQARAAMNDAGRRGQAGRARDAAKRSGSTP